MNRLLRTPDRPRVTAADDVDGPQHRGSDSAPRERDDAEVQVISGATVQAFPLAGLEVSHARTVVGSILTIDVEAMALVNGGPARATQRLVTGDTLEFVKHVGEKGAHGHPS
jgi:hypothetical protein